MPNYWLDADTLIEAKNHAYQFAVVPGFWAYLEKHSHKSGHICSPVLVHQEIVQVVGKGDDLSEWAKANISLFRSASRTVQKFAGEVSDYVMETYEYSEASRFLKGADQWLIAHAKEDSGIVVTREVLVSKDSSAAKIPNVCRHFGVKWINPYRMLKDLGVVLVLK